MANEQASVDSATAVAEFDRYAEEYDAALAKGISVSGEDKDFFARGRIVWTGRYVGKKARPQEPLAVLDYGCGTGSATPFLYQELGADSVTGVDVSAGSLVVARREHTVPGQKTRFALLDEYQPRGEIDLVFTNGVFHHIMPPDRPAAMEYVFASLRPGGWFALWENNWLSPATRYVMSRCPFDADAVPLTPATAHQMIRSHGGFEILHTDFQFIFPRVLRWLRPLETPLAKLPLGTQYLVLCRKRD